MKRTYRLLVLIAIVVLALPSPAHAYIGPGAGFALAGSFLAVFAAFFSALLLLFTWPVRLLWRGLFGWGGAGRGRVEWVVIVGLGGRGLALPGRVRADGVPA